MIDDLEKTFMKMMKKDGFTVIKKLKEMELKLNHKDYFGLYFYEVVLKRISSYVFERRAGNWEYNIILENGHFIIHAKISPQYHDYLEMIVVYKGTKKINQSFPSLHTNLDVFKRTANNLEEALRKINDDIKWSMKKEKTK